ncbi:MAG: hypothetical protein AMXMBFR13_04410 [Phycisphaerae bacterium]
MRLQIALATLSALILPILAVSCGGSPLPGGGGDTGGGTTPPPVATSCGLLGSSCTGTSGALPASIVATDLDNDGDQDLAIANFGLDTVSVRLNNGLGTFSAPRDIAVGDNPGWLTAGDFDNDGDADLAVTNLAPLVGLAVSVLRNNGDATFAPPVAYPTGGVATFVTHGDLDGDGDLDLVTANRPANNISVLLNNGTGAFNRPINFGVGQDPDAVAIADLDGDSRPDLAVSNVGSGDVYILLNRGPGSFAVMAPVAVGSHLRSIAAADLDGDGDIDLAVAEESDSLSANVDPVLIMRNQGNATFDVIAPLASGVNPYDVEIVDMNLDFIPDLVVANYGIDDSTGTVAVLIGVGGGNFRPAQLFSAGSGPTDVEAADLDGDGDPDLAVVNLVSETLSLLASSPAIFNTGG